MALTVGELALKLALDAREFFRDLDQAQRESTALDDIVTGAFERMGQLGTEALADLGGRFVAFVGDSVGVAGDFEATLNTLASVAGDSLGAAGLSIDGLRDQFLELGQTTAFSAQQAAEAGVELVKGGIDPATMAAGGLKAALDLAAAGQLDLATAANISAKQFGVWVDASASAGEKAAFLAESSDLLAQAANASTVDVGELALGLANAGGVAKVSGLSFRETVTSLALLSPGFSSAADAGTSFKTLLGRLVPTTDSQAEAMAQLGLLTEQGTSRFYDATGSFIGMEAAAQLLQDATGGLSAEQKQLALSAIFGADAIRAAAILAENGAEGYRRMTASMAGAGTAAEQAAQKNQGFNFALDSLLGAVETFQIVAGSGLLPVLTNLINQGLIPGINAVTAFTQATLDGSTWLSAAASIIGGALVPAITGLGVAAVIYATTQLPALILATQAATAALAAKAAATMAALAPYALIAVAVGGVVAAYQGFNEKVSEATTKLLESKEWWTQSTAALQAYQAVQDSTNASMTSAAATVETLRAQIESEVESLGRRMAAGAVSEAQYEAEIAAINQKRDALGVATGYLQSEIDAQTRAAAASMTATSQAQTLTEATAGMGEQASLTAKDVEELGKQIASTYEQGAKAVGAYVTTEAEFLDGVERRRAEHVAAVATLEAEKRSATTDEQRAAIDEQIAQLQASYVEQERQQATSYAEQQAAQRAHLGQLLIDYTVAQASLGNIAKDKAAEITRALEEQYGLQESSSASTFLNMAGHIDSFASDAAGDIDDLISALEDQETAAVETERAMTAMSKEYVATAVANFAEKGGEAADYAATLRGIPGEVRTRVITEYREEGTTPRSGGGSRQSGVIDDNAQKRAVGGPVQAGMPYIVGEVGRELFVPDVPGRIVPNSQLAGVGGTTTNITVHAEYRYQDERSLRDDLVLLQLLQG